MAETHKSKYKKPENKKPTYRKDLKDYTHNDKDGKLNPKTTGDKQLNVLRKTDKDVQDDGKLFPKYNVDDRLYSDLEMGEYDPKIAAKRLKKREDTEIKKSKDSLKDKVKNLTLEQRTRLIREYIRHTIVKRLIEADGEEDAAATEDPNAVTPDATAPIETTPPADAAAPTDTAPVDTTAAPATPPAPATPVDTAPATQDAATPDATTSEPTTTTPTETPEEKAKEKLAKQKIALKYWEETLSDQSGPNSLVDTGFEPLAKSLANLDNKDLRIAKIMIMRRLSKIRSTQTKETQNKK